MLEDLHGLKVPGFSTNIRRTKGSGSPLESAQSEMLYTGSVAPELKPIPTTTEVTL